MGSALAFANATTGPSNSSPAALPGLELWLRSDLGVTTGATFTWADQSGNGNNATQSTASAQPTVIASDAAYGGHPSLSFATANSQFLALASALPAQPLTLLLVGQGSPATAVQGLVADTAGAGVALYFNGSDWAEYAGSALASTNSTQGTPLAFAAVMHGASSVLYINSSSAAAASGNAGSDNPATTHIGGSGFFGFLQGKIVEVLAYNSALPAASISKLFEYFSSRYGGSWS